MPNRRSLARDYLEAFAVAVLLAVFARTFVVQAFKIPSRSMEQNLFVGDHLLVNKFVFAPAAGGLERALLPQRGIRRGDVVVFRFPEDPRRDFVKRCVGLPGDRIELRDKSLLVNGVPVQEESFVHHIDRHTYPASRFLDTSLRTRDNFGPYLVPEDHYFVLGDNRDLSNDSRFWGSVPVQYLKGRALLVYWSVEQSADAEPGAGLAGWLRQVSRLAAQVLTQTRWERCFRLVR